MAKGPCPVCQNEAALDLDSSRNVSQFNCPRCGQFQINALAKAEIENWTTRQKLNLSGWLRENQGYEFDSTNLKPLANLRTLSVGERADKMLEHLASKFPNPGEVIKQFENHLEWEAITRASDYNELNFLLWEYLEIEKKFLKYYEEPRKHYRISPSGWAHIDARRQANPNSQIGFIAMWFSESVNGAWLAINKGISAAGFKPFRVDQKQHNNKIDDEIIAGIRSSKFLVADLTDHRGGVYYEAGFAQGLGLEVIWLCRKSDLEKMHFDIRQYNCIVWQHDKLDDLTKALKVRIEARFGHGPINEVVAT